VIAARHLSRVFGDRSAVEDVTFDVAPGEIFGLLGPNGAGKTTTLRMVAGLIAPTSGEASVAGVPLTRQTIDKVRGQVGFLTEAPGLWDRLTVEVNLLTYARLHQLADPRAVVARALERFGLSDRATSLCAELSKGLKQRVAIARTLLHNPPVVLLDEPTSGLDPQSARVVRELVRELKARGHAVIISTHNLDEAERMADRVGVLRRTFLAVASPVDLRRRLFGSRVRIVMAADAAPYVGIVERAGGRESVVSGHELSFTLDDIEAGTPPVVAALVGAGAAIISVKAEDQPLEDIYFALVGHDSGEEGGA
jgi:ABC-2 type transport system ATP-binding protein